MTPTPYNPSNPPDEGEGQADPADTLIIDQLKGEAPIDVVDVD